jgi:hypothetical protein
LNNKDILNAIFINGGATLNPSDFTEYQGNDWMVGLGSSYELYHRVNNGAGDAFTNALKEVKNWCDRLNDKHSPHSVKHGERFKVGAWVDDHKPGVVVLEVSERIPDTERAIITAIKLYQSSIYHVGRREYVDVNAIIKAVKNA